MIFTRAVDPGGRRSSSCRKPATRRRATVDDAGVAGPIKGDEMANFLLAYKGGTMAETPEAQEAAMQAWMNWFGTIGAAVVDGGAPFGPSTAVQSDGSTGAATAASPATRCSRPTASTPRPPWPRDAPCSRSAAPWRSTKPSPCDRVER